MGGSVGNAGTASGGYGGHAGFGAASGSNAAGAAGSAGAETTGGSGGAAGAGPGVAGSPGSSGAPSGGAAGSNGVAGASGSVGSGGSSGAAGSGGTCGGGATFHPRAPVVFFLLDRSSSMFAPTDYWSPVKASVLATISAYASQIRFGLAAYTGVISQTCPYDLTSAGSIALDNSTNINQVLGPLASPGVKAESPTGAALATVRATVSAQSGSSKTIFLVTDGGHDFCNDTSPQCPGDAVVAELQSAFASGVQTSLFGVKGSPYLDATQTQAFANAGSGAAVVGDGQDTYYACTSEPAWNALWVAKGSQATQALGSYVASSTSNTPYALLDTTQPDTMTSALKAATAALKSCTYDLTGGQVNQALANQGVVRIDGVSIPMNSSNGWRMNSPTELELVGSACASWRTATTQTISFEFSCSILGP